MTLVIDIQGGGGGGGGGRKKESLQILDFLNFIFFLNYVGSITRHSSGKWARTHPPERAAGRVRFPLLV